MNWNLHKVQIILLQQIKVYHFLYACWYEFPMYPVHRSRSFISDSKLTIFTELSDTKLKEYVSVLSPVICTPETSIDFLLQPFLESNTIFTRIWVCYDGLLDPFPIDLKVFYSYIKSISFFSAYNRSQFNFFQIPWLVQISETGGGSWGRSTGQAYGILG